jgi:hypothetical protein
VDAVEPPTTRAILRADTTIDGVPCKGNWQYGRFSDGSLSFCNTTRRIQRDGLTIALDAYTSFHPNGRIHQTELAEPKTFALSSKTTVSCSADRVSLRSDGTLESCVIASPLVFGDVTCRGGGIAFHEGGRLAACTLDAAHSVDDLTFPPGTGLAFTPTGTLKRASFTEPRAVRGIVVRRDVEFHPNGAVSQLVLGAASTIQGNALPTGAKLTLRSDGTLAAASFLEKTDFMPHGEPRHVTRHLSFDARGRMTSSTTDVDVWERRPNGKGVWRGD